MDEWYSARLDSLTEKDSPITYGVVKPGPEGDVVFIRGGDLEFGNVRIKQLRTISTKVSDQYKRTLLRGGELLISLVGTPGQVAIVPPSLAGSNIARQVGLIRLVSDIDKRYVCYYLQSPQGLEALGAETSGSVQLVINLGALRTVKVPVPVKEEQKRIVAILDQVFADIEQARAKTEQNLKNARELFESYLQQVFSQRGEGWRGSKLLGVVQSDCSLSYGIVQPGKDFENGLPVVRPTDLATEIIELDGLKLIDPKLAESYQRTTLQGGELLLCVRGSTGVISIAADELKGANTTRGIVPIRFDSDKIIQKFGYYQFLSKKIQDQISERTYGAALMQINIRDLRKLDFSVPSLDFQAEAISKLDKISDFIDQLEGIYKRKVKDLDELKKSILQKAFTGELTNTESKGVVA